MLALLVHKILQDASLKIQHKVPVQREGQCISFLSQQRRTGPYSWVTIKAPDPGSWRRSPCQVPAGVIPTSGESIGFLSQMELITALGQGPGSFRIPAMPLSTDSANGLHLTSQQQLGFTSRKQQAGPDSCWRVWLGSELRGPLGNWRCSQILPSHPQGGTLQRALCRSLFTQGARIPSTLGGLNATRLLPEEKQQLLIA